MLEAKPVLFISDLHLSDEHPEILERFEKFINTKARHARALYILGDLFEYYLGDDATSPLIQKVCDLLKDLNQNHGVKCYVMHGNRDFLISKQFENNSKAKLINDPKLIELDGKKILLTHADQLCTDDIEYQKVRLQLRNPQWQQWFLSQSIAERIAFANDARAQSQEHTQKASSEIMDVNALAVEKLFEQYNVTHILHGHTHRPAFHTSKINDKKHLRMVLGDWHYQSSHLEYTNKKFCLIGG